MTRSLRAFACFAPALLVAACGKSGDGGPCTTCPTPAIAIGVSTNALTIVQGGNDHLTATITRSGGFTGAVTLTTEGAPAGVTATPSNVTTNGAVTTGTITVDVAASVAPGTYNLITRASGSGVTSVTQPLTLTVTAIPAIAIALSTATQSVDQGATGAAVTVTITRTNFPGNVDLTVEGAPAGVTALFTPNGTAANTSALTLQVGGAVPGAVYHLTVHAAGTGVTATPAPLDLTVTVPASFTLGATAVSIAQGGTGQSQITATRVNFPGDVTLTLEGAPQGVTGEFNPSPLSGTAGTLDLVVASTVAAQQYTLTVRGAAAPLADRTTTFILTVTPFVAVGSYTLSTSPSSNVLVATASGGTAFVVHVNRTGGFTGAVTLAGSGLPGNLTATITPSVVTGNSAVVKVVPDLSSTVGSSQMTITGTTPGLSNKTAQIQVATDVPNITFDYSACSFDVPVALWYQDGTSGPWVELLPLGGKFKIKLSQPKVGFAVSTPAFGGGGQPPWVRLRSVAELQAFTVHDFCDDGNPGPNSVNVSAVGLQSIFDAGLVEFGGVQHQVGGTLPNVTLTGVPAGIHDLVARSANQSGGPIQPTDRIIIRRSIPSTIGTITPALNFDPAPTSEGFAPIPAAMSVSGFITGETLNGFGTGYYTLGSPTTCDGTTLYGQSFFAAVSNFTAYGVPAGKQLATDMHRVIVSTSTPTTFRQVTEYFHSFGPRAIALGSNLPVPTISSLSGPTFRLQFAFTLPVDLGGSIFASYTTAFNSQRGFLDASAGWAGGGAVTLTMPDFSGSADFDPITLQAPVGSSSWTITAQGQLVDPCAGGRVVAANRSGVFP